MALSLDDYQQDHEQFGQEYEQFGQDYEQFRQNYPLTEATATGPGLSSTDKSANHVPAVEDDLAHLRNSISPWRRNVLVLYMCCTQLING